MQSSSFSKGLIIHRDFGIKVEIQKIVGDRHDSPMVSRDLQEFTGDKGIIIIDKILVPRDLRNRGIGTTILKSLIQEYSDCVIIAMAGSLKEEYSESNYENTCRASEFFEKNGFVAINGLTKYEDWIPSMYIGNSAGKVTLTNLINKSRSFISR